MTDQPTPRLGFPDDRHWLATTGPLTYGPAATSPPELDAINRALTPPTPEVLRRLHDALTRLGPIDPADYWPDDQGDPVTVPDPDELLTQASAELLGIVSDDTDTEHALAELHTTMKRSDDQEPTP